MADFYGFQRCLSVLLAATLRFIRNAVSVCAATQILPQQCRNALKPAMALSFRDCVAVLRILAGVAEKVCTGRRHR